MGKNGVYRAQVIINGVVDYKTFFPCNWQRKKVIAKIIEAYDNFIASGVEAIFHKGKYSCVGTTNEGINIQMHITLSGNITIACPILEI